MLAWNQDVGFVFNEFKAPLLKLTDELETSHKCATTKILSILYTEKNIHIIIKCIRSKEKCGGNV